MKDTTTNLTTLPDLVNLIDGKAVTTSRKIAEVFGKDHKHVLEAIRTLEIPEDFGRSNFRPTEYSWVNNLGKTVKSPMYLITRDGFTLLAMGFTGKAAMQFKLAYIEAFNAMEAALKEETLDLAESTRRMLRALNTRIEAGERISAHILKYAWNIANCSRVVVPVRYAADDPDEEEIRAVFSVFAPGTHSRREVYKAYCDGCHGTPVSARRFWPVARKVCHFTETRRPGGFVIVIKKEN